MKRRGFLGAIAGGAATLVSVPKIKAQPVIQKLEKGELSDDEALEQALAESREEARGIDHQQIAFEVLVDDTVRKYDVITNNGDVYSKASIFGDRLLGVVTGISSGRVATVVSWGIIEIEGFEKVFNQWIQTGMSVPTLFWGKDGLTTEAPCDSYAWVHQVGVMRSPYHLEVGIDLKYVLDF